MGFMSELSHGDELGQRAVERTHNHQVRTQEVSLPWVLISGTFIGKRVFNWTGVLSVVDPANRLFGELILNPNKKGFFSRSVTPYDCSKGNVAVVGRPLRFHSCRLRKDIKQREKDSPRLFRRVAVQHRRLLAAVHGR